MLLRFQVQGSAATPYKLTAEGSGSSFRIFCSCPGGRMGGKLCKHAAGLVRGDASKLVQPSDSLDELLARAAGSSTGARAQTFTPEERPEIEGFANLAEVMDGFAAGFEAAGWTVQRSTAVDGSADEIGLYGRTKTGRVRANASVSLAYERDGFDLVVAENGSLTQVETGPRQRPWIARGPSGASSFAKLGRALARFVRLAQDTPVR